MHQSAPGNLMKLIGVFTRVNATQLPPRHTFDDAGEVTDVVISKGMFQCQLNGQQINVTIPADQQVDTETYHGFVPLLTSELVSYFQIPHLAIDVQASLMGDGIAFHHQGPTLVANPLKAGYGEQDYF